MSRRNGARRGQKRACTRAMRALRALGPPSLLLLLLLLLPLLLLLLLAGWLCANTPLRSAARARGAAGAVT